MKLRKSISYIRKTACHVLHSKDVLQDSHEVSFHCEDSVGAGEVGASGQWNYHQDYDQNWTAKKGAHTFNTMNLKSVW